MYGHRQISICRGGPAADSLRTLVVDVRILIALDWYCGKFRFIGQIAAQPLPSPGGQCHQLKDSISKYQKGAAIIVQNTT